MLNLYFRGPVQPLYRHDGHSPYGAGQMTILQPNLALKAVVKINTNCKAIHMLKTIVEMTNSIPEILVSLKMDVFPFTFLGLCQLKCLKSIFI